MPLPEWRYGLAKNIIPLWSLFQEYAVDIYSRIEAARLCYFETHQKEIRAD